MLEFKEQDGGYYVVERHKDNTITTFGIVRKAESTAVGSYVFDPTNFSYSSGELIEIGEFLAGLKLSVLLMKGNTDEHSQI